MNAVGGTCQLWFLAEPGLIAAICLFRLDLRKVSAMPGTWQASKIAGQSCQRRTQFAIGGRGVPQ
jgi:hypothetical protein